MPGKGKPQPGSVDDAWPRFVHGRTLAESALHGVIDKTSAPIDGGNDDYQAR
jgi:hypothetical protein